MSAPAHASVEELLRALAPHVLGALTRRYGRFDACEDAVQEALLAAALQWPAKGVPEQPRGWLIRVAARRLLDQQRAAAARSRREAIAAALTPPAPSVGPSEGEHSSADQDDSLTLLFLCCHPALSPPSQVALTLRAVGGLRTAEIARAFLVPEATMGQRISRAKQQIKASRLPFAPPPEGERAERLQSVLQVLYLIFNEGYTASAGPQLQRAELTNEAIRLARLLRHQLPHDGEVAGLLALMLLTDARRAARSGQDGTLVPLAEQNRALWDRNAIREGAGLITHALAHAQLGPYQLQAAIAALHAEAARPEETDWRQILALYDLLEQLAPSPVVALNRAVAVSMVHGAHAGLVLLDALEADERLARQHRLAAVRGHLLELVGDVRGAVASYREAARRTTSLPEQHYLERRAARLNADGSPGSRIQPSSD